MANSTSKKKKTGSKVKSSPRRARSKAKAEPTPEPAETVAPPLEEQAEPSMQAEQAAPAEPVTQQPEPAAESAAPVAEEAAPASQPAIPDLQPTSMVSPPRAPGRGTSVVMAVSFFLAIYLGLEAASMLKAFPVSLPIANLLVTHGHVPGGIAATSLVVVLVFEILLVQLWAVRARGPTRQLLQETVVAPEVPKQEITEPVAPPQVEAPVQATAPPQIGAPVETIPPPPEPVVQPPTPPQSEATPAEAVSIPELEVPTPPGPEIPEVKPQEAEEAQKPEQPAVAEVPIEKPVEQAEVKVEQPQTPEAPAQKEQAVVLSQVKQAPPAEQAMAPAPKPVAQVARPVGPVVAPQPEKPRENFIASYPIYANNPDVFVGIERDPESGGFRYVVVEPKLSPTEKQVYTNLTKLLVDELEVDMRRLKSTKGAEAYLVREAKAVANKYNVTIPPESYKKIAYYFARDFVKLGKIEVFMNDPRIEDISCDGPGVPIFIWHRDYESIPTNVMFNDEKELDVFAAKLAYVSGKHISIANPIVDANLPDGSRIQITYGTEVSKRGGNFTIRKFRADPITIVDLLKYNTVSPELGAYLWYLIEKRMSILVAGGTASGKTTTLNALSMFIPPDEKIVSVEDTPELNLSHKNWIQSISRGGSVAGEITLFDLLKNALRQRPDIIIVGEVRGAEAFTLFQAIATGHGGLGTVHADSVQAAVNRLTTEPMNVPKSLLGSTLDCVVMQLRIKLKEKSVRRMVNVAEIVGHETSTDQIVLNNAFKWDPVTDNYVFSGRSRLFEKITKRFGTPPDHIRADIEDRRIFLTWVMKKNIRDYRDLSQQIREFYSDPRTSIDRAIRGLEESNVEG